MTEYMDIAEFREKGYLQEVNRNFLHPLGLALAVKVDEDGTETLAGVIDARDDPEGVCFEALGDDEAKRAAQIGAEWSARSGARFDALRYVVQPVPSTEA